VPHMLPRGGERFPLVTRALVRRAHAAGVHLHVWTVDDPAEMEQLVDLGVDGLITDRTDLLKHVLIDRGLWREP
jgi:glycerophosphoryl diester phosphodiesterase